MIHWKAAGLTILVLALSLLLGILEGCGTDKEPDEEVIIRDTEYECAEDVVVELIDEFEGGRTYSFRISGNFMIHHLHTEDGSPLSAYPGDVVRVETEGIINMGPIFSEEDHFGAPGMHMFMQYGMGAPDLIGNHGEKLIIGVPADVPKKLVFYIIELPPFFICTLNVENWYDDNYGDFYGEVTILYSH